MAPSTLNNEEGRTFMGKYYLTYGLFLLPALVVALFLKNGSAASIMAQWFFALLMLFGFCATTYLAAYQYPRGVLSLILMYAGMNLIIFYLFYKSLYGSAAYHFLRDYGGALSYVPLGILVDTLNDFTVNIEIYVILAVTSCMLMGYLAALVKRRVKPYPYTPRIG